MLPRNWVFWRGARAAFWQGGSHESHEPLPWAGLQIPQARRALLSHAPDKASLEYTDPFWHHVMNPKTLRTIFFLLNWLHFPCQCQHSGEVWAGDFIPLGIPRCSANSPSAKGLLIPAYLFSKEEVKSLIHPHLPHINKVSQAQ